MPEELLPGDGRKLARIRTWRVGEEQGQLSFSAMGGGRKLVGSLDPVIYVAVVTR